MKIFFGTKIVGVACLGMCLPLARGQSIWSAPAAKASCGPKNANFDVKLDYNQPAQPQPVNGKVVIYILQDVNPTYFLSVNSRVGLDGAWVGANRNSSYFGFTVDPGVHHLCVGVNFQSSTSIVLRQLEAKAGATYYFRVQFLASRGVGGFLLELEPVDEDEGQFLIQTSAHSTSHLKNKH